MDFIRALSAEEVDKREKQNARNRLRRALPKKKKEEEAKKKKEEETLVQAMKDNGWVFRKGDGLVSSYFVHSDYAQLEKRELLRECTEGEHYFTSEEAVRRYAKENLGWQGEVYTGRVLIVRKRSIQTAGDALAAQRLSSKPFGSSPAAGSGAAPAATLSGKKNDFVGMAQSNCSGGKKQPFLFGSGSAQQTGCGKSGESEFGRLPGDGTEFGGGLGSGNVKFGATAGQFETNTPQFNLKSIQIVDDVSTMQGHTEEKAEKPPAKSAKHTSDAGEYDKSEDTKDEEEVADNSSLGKRAQNAPLDCRLNKVARSCNKPVSMRNCDKPVGESDDKSLAKRMKDVEEFLRRSLNADNEKDDALRKLDVMKKDLHAAVSTKNAVEHKLNLAQQREALALREKNKALSKLDAMTKERNAAKEGEASAVDAVIAARKERDEALRKLECFDCFRHENGLYVFFPCAHKVCSACRHKYAVETPCPKCRKIIMGRMQLYND